jgi:hypothetical protein
MSTDLDHPGIITKGVITVQLHEDARPYPIPEGGFWPGFNLVPSNWIVSASYPCEIKPALPGAINTTMLNAVLRNLHSAALFAAPPNVAIETLLRNRSWAGTQQQLAERIGRTRKTTSAKLAEMKRRGLVRVELRRIEWIGDQT